MDRRASLSVIKYSEIFGRSKFSFLHGILLGFTLKLTSERSDGYLTFSAKKKSEAFRDYKVRLECKKLQGNVV